MMVCTVTISFFYGLEDVALICNRCRINYRAQCQKGVKEETIIKPCSSTPGTCHLIIHPNSFFCSFREWKTTSQKKAGHPGKPFLLVLTPRFFLMSYHYFINLSPWFWVTLFSRI